jgi:alkanesulfonate monooxygenase SsuD/methylene tetrahydromethanopterin reductase-like flavin-dependent oxidoreductase (luciferase family)
LAAYFGLPYAFAYFFSEGTGVEQALALYRDTFRPSAVCPEPYATICVAALAADTEEEAQWQFKTRERSTIDREFGIRLPLISPAEAASKVLTQAERQVSERLRRKALVGSGAHVAERLQDLAARLALDELVVVTWTFDPEPRLRSYELLAKAFAMSA